MPPNKQTFDHKNNFFEIIVASFFDLSHSKFDVLKQRLGRNKAVAIKEGRRKEIEARKEEIWEE